MPPAHVYENVATRLLARDPPPPLSPRGVYEPELTAQIDALDISEACKAVLHLLNDDLPRSHELSQTGEGDATFDYLHSIVHRREGDFGNCKYWLRRAEGHPVLSRIFGGDSAAISFVDRCRATGPHSSRELEELQMRELGALLDETARVTQAR